MSSLLPFLWCRGIQLAVCTLFSGRPCGAMLVPLHRPFLLLAIPVAVHDKTRRGIFRKVAIAIYINSTTLARNLRPIASSVSKIQRPLYAITRTIELEKLWSNALLRTRMRTPYTTSIRKSILGGASRSNQTSEQIEWWYVQDR